MKRSFSITRLLSLLTLVLCTALGAIAQPNVKMGLFQVPGQDSLEVRILPDAALTAGNLVSSATVTVRYRTNAGVTLNDAQLVSGNWPAGFDTPSKDIVVRTDGGYTYVTYTCINSELLDGATEWAANTERAFFRIGYTNSTGSCVTFRAVDDAFQASEGVQWTIFINAAEQRDVNGYIGTAPYPVHNTTTDEYYCNIQQAIDDATTQNGHVITVAAGTYAENVNVTKGVELRGANHNVSCLTGRGAESIIAPASGTPITVSADGVTISGFELTAPGNAYALEASGRSNLSFHHNRVHDIGTTVLNTNVHAFAYTANVSAGTISVADNCFKDIGNTSNIRSASAITVGFSTDNGVVTGLVIERNRIEDVFSSPAAFPNGRGAYGILVNLGAGSGTGLVSNGIIRNNEIDDLSGHWAHGIGLEGETPGMLVEENTISDLSSTKVPSDAIGVNIEDNAGVATVQVINNAFLNTAIGIQNNMATAPLPCTGNWFGSATPAVVYASFRGNVDVTPFNTDGTDTDLVEMGFQPNPASNTGSGPVVSNSPADSYWTIQAGVDGSNAGAMITVAAGTYAETIFIDKQLDIRGPNYGITPNGGTRAAEAVIVPAFNDPDPNSVNSSAIIYLDPAATGTSIQGFTIDGDNPALSGGLAMNGADVNAIEAMAAYEGIGSITFQHNIVQNFSYAGLDLYNYYNGGTATTGNLVNANKFDNIIPTSFGVAVLIYNNCYTSITNNVMTRVRLGVQTGNFYNADPGNSRAITGNSIESSRIGVFHNLAYSNASWLNISNNAFTTVSGATTNNGVLVSSLQSAVGVTLSNNNVTGAQNGINLWNCPTTAGVVVTGGVLTNCDNGVFANNYDGYTSDATSSGYTVNGTSIVGGTNALYVKDNSLNSNGATVALTVLGGVSVNGSTTGLRVEGGSASASFSGPGAAALAGVTTYIELVSNGTDKPAGSIDATNVGFNGVSGITATDAQLFAIEDKITHRIDDRQTGLVTVKASNLHVTDIASATATNNDYTRLANAMSAIGSNWTVHLSGSFDWTEANAAASWALGNNGTDQALDWWEASTSTQSDDYALVLPAGLTGVTLTAGTLGDASILGPGDMASHDGETCLALWGAGGYQNWTISNLTINDFDESVIMFWDGPTTDFNGMTVTGNSIRIPADLNPADNPVDAFQNIGVHFSFGSNQTISNNQFEVVGNGLSNGTNYSSTVVMQSNTSGGSVYNGLQITGNSISVTGTLAAQPSTVLGIWDNCHAHTSTITVSGNSFTNNTGANASTNLMRAFRVTSHSGASSTVTYSGNSMSGANVGMQWITGSDFSAQQPVVVSGNSLNGCATGLLVQSNGKATLTNNDMDDATDNAIDVDVVAGSVVTSAGGNQWGGDNYYVRNNSSSAIPLLSDSFDESDNFRRADRVYDALDNATSGLVRYTATDLYVSAPGTGSSDETIQRGIDASTAGQTLHVENGTYPEFVTVNKSMTVLGQSIAATIKAPYSSDNSQANTVTIGSTNVTLKDLTITRDWGVDQTSWNACTVNQGINFNGLTGITLQGLHVKDNRNGIFCNNSQNVLITECLIEDNRTGIQFGNNVSGLQFTNNNVRNNFTHGLGFNFDFGLMTLTNVNVEGNSITGNWYSQVNFQRNASFVGTNIGDLTGLDLTCNWYGTTSPMINGIAAGEPGYTAQLPSQLGGTDPGLSNRYLVGLHAYLIGSSHIPFLTNGTDNDLVTYGFQPAPFACGGYPVINTNTSEGFATITAAHDDPDTQNGHTLALAAWTFNERVSLTKSLTLDGDGETTTILDGTGLAGTGSGISLPNGLQNVTIQDLTIRNYAGTDPFTHAGIKAYGNNDGFTAQNLTIKDNVGGSGIFMTGPVSNVLMNNLDVSGHTGGARGIVIWDHLKTNIAITNCDVYNNNCCGIELQDGTASGVTLTGNNVHDNADNGMGLTGMGGNVGANLVANNTLTNNGRFGIEVKMPGGNGLASGTGSVVVQNNTVTFASSPAMNNRDHAGIAVFRRAMLPGNSYGNSDIPTGVQVLNNTVSGYTQVYSGAEGYGIVVEGVDHTVSNNTVSGCDVGLQLQGGGHNAPNYVENSSGDGDQANGQSPNYFGRGNAPYVCNVSVSGNTLTNTVNEQVVTSAGVLSTPAATNQKAKRVELNGTTYCSIQKAVDKATTGQTANVYTATYDEQVLVNKSMTIDGASPKPTVDFTGTVSGKPTLFDVSAQNVVLRDMIMNVDLRKLSSAVIATSATGIGGLQLLNNDVMPYASSAGASFGGYGTRNAFSVNYGGYRVTGGGGDVTFTGNTVGGRLASDPLANGTARFFRAGLSMDECFGTASNNTLLTINQDVEARFGQGGGLTVQNNQFNGGGLQVSDPNAGGGPITVSGNTFDGTFGNTYTNMLRLKNNYTGLSATVSGNTFTNTGWAASLENFSNVAVSNNTFTPVSGSTTYRHLTVNTKELSSSSGFYAPVVGLTLQGNTFNGSGTPGGTGVAFYNHDNDSPVFGTFTIGGAGPLANTFNSGIGTFVRLDNSTGTTNPAPPAFPEYAGLPATTMACWSTGMDISENLFDVGGGAKTPGAMSSGELVSLEGALFHQVDDACAGKLTALHLRLAAAALLQGPYNGGQMDDGLRVANYIPTAQPYNYAPFNYAGTETTTAGVLAVSGSDAIVDWVLVELRDAVTPTIVVASRAALLQRDGDIVDVDGTSPVSFTELSNGNYHVVVRHRNHLGVMTATATALSPVVSTTVDFSDPMFGAYGTDARKVIGGDAVLWMGNSRADNRLKYTGIQNDRDPILVRIGGTVPTAVANGYWQEDNTMDGQVKYTGGSNDRDPILTNLPGNVTTTRTEQLP